MPAVAVFDTNVLFSGLGWKGRPYECLDLARRGSVTGLTCAEILDELMEKLEAKLQFSPEQLAETLADLLSFLHLVRIRNELNPHFSSHLKMRRGRTPRSGVFRCGGVCGCRTGQCGGHG
jgi:predicted nucleic acid-binding protein